MNVWIYPFDPPEFEEEKIETPISPSLKSDLVRLICDHLGSEGIEYRNQEAVFDGDLVASIFFKCGSASIEISVSSYGIQIEGDKFVSTWFEFEHEISIKAIQSGLRKTLNTLLSNHRPNP